MVSLAKSLKCSFEEQGLSVYGECATRREIPFSFANSVNFGVISV